MERTPKSRMFHTGLESGNFFADGGNSIPINRTAGGVYVNACKHFEMLLLGKSVISYFDGSVVQWGSRLMDEAREFQAFRRDLFGRVAFPLPASA